MAVRARHTASTQTTASLAALATTFAHSGAQTDSRIPRRATQLRANVVRLRSSATVSAWLQGYAPRAKLLVRREAGPAAVLARILDLDGQPAAFLEVVLAHGSVSTLLVTLKAVRALMFLTTALYRK
jgi:hypothetical protein